MIVDRLEGRILPYSARLELLSAAAGFGIGRFHANLMIAAVQHQLGDGQARSHVPGPGARWHLAAAVLLIQSVILFAAWILIVR